MFKELEGFKGFAIEYDQSANPFFEKIMIENLSLLQSKSLGRKLLRRIGRATPKARADFPIGIHVICRPYMMQYVQSGSRLRTEVKLDGSEVAYAMSPSSEEHHNVKRLEESQSAGWETWRKSCSFHKRGSSLNKAAVPPEMSKGGSVCFMDFSNAQVMESNGAMCWPHIVLAHELIHSLHCLRGEHANENEERKTVGMDEFADEELTENAFRVAFGLDPRDAYGH